MYVSVGVAPVVTLLGDELVARGVGCEKGLSIGRHQAHNGAVHAFLRQRTTDVALDLDFLGIEIYCEKRKDKK